MRQPGLLVLTVAAAVIIGAVRLYGVGRPTASRNSAAEGVYLTRAEVIERSRQLTGRLWPERQNVQMKPDLTVAAWDVRLPLSLRHAVSPVWLVTCEDIHGGALGTITWNAASGELRRVIARPNDITEADMPSPVMKPKQVRRLTRQWLRGLVGRNTGETWNEIGERARPRAVISDWVSEGRKAHLSVSSVTGELIVFCITHGSLAANR